MEGLSDEVTRGVRSDELWFELLCCLNIPLRALLADCLLLLVSIYLGSLRSGRSLSFYRRLVVSLVRLLMVHREENSLRVGMVEG